MILQKIELFNFRSFYGKQVIEFNDDDIVRNSLVSKIVSKYDNFEKKAGIGRKYFIKEDEN